MSELEELRDLVERLQKRGAYLEALHGAAFNKRSEEIDIALVENPKLKQERDAANARAELDRNERAAEVEHREALQARLEEVTRERDFAVQTFRGGVEEMPQLLARLAKAEELLAGWSKTCLCYGTGEYWPECPQCGDSTDEHECPGKQPCDSSRCIETRAFLAESAPAAKVKCSQQAGSIEHTWPCPVHDAKPAAQPKAEPLRGGHGTDEVEP